MKRPSIAAILTLCVAVLVSLPTAFPVAAQGQPEAAVAEPHKDFGQVAKGDKVEHAFVIENKGDADLEITRVVPTCGCTVADFDRVIPPGKTGKVHAIVDSKTLKGPSVKTIAVYTNDPDNPALQLVFKIDVVSHLSIEPGFARYLTVQGESAKGLIKQVIWSDDGTPFEVVKVESPYNHLATSFRPAREEERQEDVEGKQWVVEMELLYNQAPVGPLTDYVVVHTDHPKQKVVQIPVSGFIRPSMWTTPDKVDLGSVKLEEPVKFSVMLQSFLADPVEVTKVESTVKGVVAEVSPIQEGRKFNVVVTLKPGLPQGRFDGKLLIHTSTPKKPVVEVPLRGTVL